MTTTTISLPSADDLDTGGWAEHSGRHVALYLVPAVERDDERPHVVAFSYVGQNCWPTIAHLDRAKHLFTYGVGVVGESVRESLQCLADRLVELSDEYQGSSWDGSNNRGQWTELASEIQGEIACDSIWDEIATYCDAADWLEGSVDFPAHELIAEIQRAGSIDAWVEKVESEAAHDGVHLHHTERYVRDRLTEIASTDALTELRTEAGAAGDLAQVALCELALAGTDDAFVECARVITEAN